ncbi:MAG TPA: hypothetical protein VJC16_03165 [Candidatus Nanoarchaeia archaeon]|nr:hypothetical protein [Candidatus Nanoarchaeia archaeon]
MVNGYWTADLGEIAFLLLSIPALVFWYWAARRKKSIYLMLCQLGLVFIILSVGLEIINGNALISDIATVGEHLFMLLGSAITSMFIITIARRL